MFLTGKPGKWRRIGDIKRRRALRGFDFDIFLILNSVWNREVGHLSEHCSLLGATRNSIIVSADSSVVSNELFLRSGSIIKNLNKYFRKPWIREIKISRKI